MLLFDSDYSSHSGIIDLETKNYSFLRMAGVLEQMDIKNKYFFLHLSQPELQGIDPHNLKDPSLELRAKIIVEVKTNGWYFLREIVRMPSAGGDPIMYILNRANLAVAWCFFNSINLFGTFPRQTGKSAGIAALITWLMYYVYKNATIGLFAKDTDLVHESIAGVKSIRKGLPQWMLNLTPQDTDNKEGMSYDALNTTYKTFVAKPELIAAKKQGRGERLGIEYWDEMAFYKNNNLSYPSATAASDKAQAQIRALGLPACNIITTTAGRLSEPSGAYAYSIKQNCVRFVERFYDAKDIIDLKNLIAINSLNKMTYIEYSYKQLGFTDEWLSDKIIDKPRDVVEMDYLNLWQLGTETSIIPAELLAKASSSERDPVDYTQTGHLVVKWYVEKDIILSNPNNLKKRYVVGLDTSDNVGQDYTTMVILDPTDLTVVATCRCNVANFMHVATCVIDVMEMLPNSIIIPERNKNGAVMVDIIIEYLIKKGEDPFTRIYNTFIQDYNENTPDFANVDLSNGTNRKRFGFNTTSAADSRDTLFSRVLIMMLGYMASRVFDSDLIAEIKGLIVRNGRIDHAPGCHDDLCIAMLLAGYFIFFGKNHYMYGIPRDEILRNVSAVGDQVDAEQKIRQLAIRKRIVDLKQLMVSCTNEMVKSSYERELRSLESQVDASMFTGDVLNVEQIRRNTNIMPSKPRELDIRTLTKVFF